MTKHATRKLKRDVDGQWRVHLVAANGEEYVGAESYATKSNAMRSAKRMPAIVAEAAKYEVEVVGT